MSIEADSRPTQPCATTRQLPPAPAVHIVEPPNEPDVEALRMRETWDQVVCEELEIPDAYRKVAVLIVHWQPDLDVDLKCDAEVKELHEVFTKGFKFDSEILTLDDAKRPQLQLNHALSGLVLEHDGHCRSNLLIVYYTGHGSPEGAHGLNILGARDLRGCVSHHLPVADWNAAEDSLKMAEADVLTILDTCYAGNIFKGVTEEVKSFHVLAAAGRDMPTSPPGPNSFTRALIDCLKSKLEEHRGAPFTASELHYAIQSRRCDTSSLFFPRFSGRISREIKLAPLTPTTTEATVLASPGQDAAHLTLRFAFKDHVSLDDEQIKILAREISGSVRKADLNVRAIDFLDFKQYESAPSVRQRKLWRKSVDFIRAQERLRRAAADGRRKRTASEAEVPSNKRLRCDTDVDNDPFEPATPSATSCNEESSTCS